jgi:hypothetical protein
MSLQNQLTAASSREQYVAVLKVTLTELATVLCRLAQDEDLPQPYRVTFRDQSLLYSLVAELWINDTMGWTKEPEARDLSLPISGRLTSRDGRTITLDTLE